MSADDTGPRLHLKRIQPRVLRQEVLEALRTAILASEIPIGSRLLEADVAARMGVSRAPVREAIRHLEQEGLVEIVPHRGAVVVGLPEAEIEAIHELRAVIESRATASVAGTADGERLTELDAIVEEMRAAAVAREVDAVAAIDLRFHGLLVEWSGMTLLRHVWSSLDGLVRVRSYQAIGRTDEAGHDLLEDLATSHQDIVGAIRTGDPAVAAEVARRHVL